MTTKTILWAEFIGFFLLLPLAMALAMPPGWMFPVLFVMTGLGAVLLHLTPGFRWGELLRGAGRIDWRQVAGFALATAAFGSAVILALRPEAFLALPRQQPALLAAILLLYPVLSALPQELIFRPLFFRRYGSLLPAGRAAIVLNALVFALAHLMYWNWPAVLMTFGGGLVFAHVYARQGSFPAAVVLHAVAGGILFTLGLGVFFYTGYVERPF